MSRRLRLASAALALALCALVLSGCTERDSSTDFLDEFLQGTAEPFNEDGQFDADGAVNLVGTVTGRSSSDPEVKATLDAGSVFGGIDEADALAAQADAARARGRLDFAVSYIEDAIALRPGDLTYRWKLAAILAEMGYLDAEKEALRAVDRGQGLPEATVTDRSAFVAAETAIREYEQALENTQIQTGVIADRQRQYISDRLAAAWWLKWSYLKFHGRPGVDAARLQAEYYQAEADRP